MKLSITANLDNAAFAEDPDSDEHNIDPLAVADWLRTIADKIEADGVLYAEQPLRDVNGNLVGALRMED
jgi:hypothetical protein